MAHSLSMATAAPNAGYTGVREVVGRSGRFGFAVAGSPLCNRRPPPARPDVVSDDEPRGVRPTIARIWRGRVRADQADEYEAYYMNAGIAPLIDAALGVQALREDRGDEVEFVTISYWEDVAAMSRFAGDDPRRIHHLDRDPEFLIELPTDVQVLEIRSAHGDSGGR